MLTLPSQLYCAEKWANYNSKLLVPMIVRVASAGVLLLFFRGKDKFQICLCLAESVGGRSIMLRKERHMSVPKLLLRQYYYSTTTVLLLILLPKRYNRQIFELKLLPCCCCCNRIVDTVPDISS